MIENFFGLLKSKLRHLQKFQSAEHFKQELIEYMDYYNNHRIKAKRKGLPPAIHRQQALSAYCSINIASLIQNPSLQRFQILFGVNVQQLLGALCLHTAHKLRVGFQHSAAPLPCGQAAQLGKKTA